MRYNKDIPLQKRIVHGSSNRFPVCTVAGGIPGGTVSGSRIPGYAQSGILIGCYVSMRRGVSG